MHGMYRVSVAWKVQGIGCMEGNGCSTDHTFTNLHRRYFSGHSFAMLCHLLVSNYNSMSKYWSDHTSLRATPNVVLDRTKKVSPSNRPIYRARRTPGGSHNITVGEVLGPTCVPISFSGVSAPCIYAQEKFDATDYAQMLTELFDIRPVWLKSCLLEVLTLFMSAHCASRTLKAVLKVDASKVGTDCIIEGTQLGTTQKVYCRAAMEGAPSSPEEARGLLWFRDEHSLALLSWVFKWTDVTVSRAYWVITGLAADDSDMVPSYARLGRLHATFIASPGALSLDAWYAKIAKYTRHLQRGAVSHYVASVESLATLAIEWSNHTCPPAPREATIFNGAAGLVAHLNVTPGEQLPLHELKGTVGRMWHSLRAKFPHIHVASQLPPQGPTEREYDKRLAKMTVLPKDADSRHDGPDYLFYRGGQGVDALMLNIGVKYADKTSTIVQVMPLWVCR